MHLADAFIQSDLHCIQVTVFTFYQLLLSLGIEPMILALLAPCSTTWATGKLFTPKYFKEYFVNMLMVKHVNTIVLFHLHGTTIVSWTCAILWYSWEHPGLAYKMWYMNFNSMVYLKVPWYYHMRLSLYHGINTVLFVTIPSDTITIYFVGDDILLKNIVVLTPKPWYYHGTFSLTKMFFGPGNPVIFGHVPC